MFIYGGDLESAYRVCRIAGQSSVMCPLWRREFTDDWVGKARWFEERRRREVAEKAAKESEPIPE